MARRQQNTALKPTGLEAAAPSDARLTEELFRSFTENIEQIIWMTDIQTGKLLYINPAYERIFGLPVEHAYREANAFLKVVHPEDDAMVRQYLEMRKTGEKSELVYRIIRRDGSVGWIWTRAYRVLNDEGRPHRIVGIVQDITERKLLEEELLHTKKMQAIGELAGGIAHDFNNLLTPILGYSSMLARGGVSELRATRVGAVIQQAATRASELTQQLLAFARKGKQRNIPVDIHNTLDSVIELCERTFEKKVAISRDFADEVFMVQGDPGQMHQVFLNLAINARDAVSSSTHEPLIEFSTSRTMGPEGQPGRWVCITVRDNGTGMDEATKARAFEPFFTTKDIGQGTGLGLATVYGVVSNHGGSITIDSAPGCGCTFRIKLPLTNPVFEQEQAPEAPVSPKSAMNALIIDDDQIVIELARDLLSSLGCTVAAYSEPTAAVKFFESHSKEIDFVLLDMLMPKMNGAECLALLQQIDPEVKVVISSGCSLADSYEHLLTEDRVVALLQKPYTVDRFTQVLEAVRSGAAASHRALPGS